ITVAMIDEGYIARARVQNTRSRNDKPAAERNRNADIYEHARPERDSRIVEDEAHRNGASRDVDLRQDLINPSFKRPARISIDCHCGGYPWLQSANVGLKYVGIHPDRGKVGDGIELR